MENASNRVIEDYIQRVLELRQSQSLQQADLEALALELGMTAADIAAAQQKAQDHLTRGKSYLQFQRWDDAISELKQAVALNPVDRDWLHTLAAAYQSRYQQRRQSADKAAAITLAQQCLAMQPNDMAAIELISALDQPAQGYSQIPWLVGGGAGILVVLLGLLVGLWWIAPGEVLAPKPAPVGELGEDEATVEETRVDNAITLTDPAMDIPVEFAAPGLMIEPRLSRLNHYSESSYYKLQGVLINQSDQALSQLRLRVDYLDAQGNAIATDSQEILSDSDAELRPGDAQAFDWVEKLNPNLARVQLTVTTLDQTPAASQYAASPTVNYTWGFTAPAELKFAIAARSDQFQNYGAGSAYHDAVFAVTNMGEVAIKQLKLQIDFVNAQHQVIGSEDVLIVYGDDAPLLPGEVRPKRSIHSVGQDYTGYRLTVLEAE